MNVELNNYDDEFSSVNETIICCVLIIREEYPEFYDKIYNNCSLLINYEYSNNEEDKRLFVADKAFAEYHGGVQQCDGRRAAPDRRLCRTQRRPGVRRLGDGHDRPRRSMNQA